MSDLIVWKTPTTDRIKWIQRGAVLINNCPNAFKTSHPCKLAVCNLCYQKHEENGGEGATGKRAMMRNNAERNIAIAEVGAEREKRTHKQGHTHCYMKHMQITTD